MQETDPNIVVERCHAIAARGLATDGASAGSRMRVSIASELSERYDVERVCVAADEQAAIDLPRDQVAEIEAHKPITVELATAQPARALTVYVQLRDRRTRQYHWQMPGHHNMTARGARGSRVSVTVYETDREPWYERPTMKWADSTGD